MSCVNCKHPAKTHVPPSEALANGEVCLVPQCKCTAWEAGHMLPTENEKYGDMIYAHEKVFAALNPLSIEQARRVLKAAAILLEVEL